MATAIPVVQGENGNLKMLCLIWLDSESSEETRIIEEKLRSIIYKLETFQDVSKCVEYMQQTSDKDQLILVVSGQLRREILPWIDGIDQVVSVYIYCSDEKKNERWYSEYDSKVRCVLTNIDEFILDIKNRYSVSKRFVESLPVFFCSDQQYTNELSEKFVHFQVFIECLSKLKFVDEDKNELIQLLKDHYGFHSREIENIDCFEREYLPEKALWWYTKDCFFYVTLNYALRTENIHWIYLHRAYIFDIQRQLKLNQIKEIVKVYRGQQISKRELNSLKNSINRFISIKSFFSTSTKRSQALKFLNPRNTVDNFENVLFEIEANPNVGKTKSFADISKLSVLPDEEEILFTIGSIFNVKKISYNDVNYCWIIEMTLVSNEDSELKVLDYMKQKIGNTQTTLRTLSNILFDMEKFDLAGIYLERFLKQLSPYDHLRVNLYTDLAKVASKMGGYDKSTEWSQQLIRFVQQNLSTISKVDLDNLIQIKSSDIEFYEKIGSGGFGTVHRAKRLTNAMIVAVKRLHLICLSVDKEAVFLNELFLLNRICHPNIIHFYGACIENGSYALVMEFMCSGSLYQLLREKKNPTSWSHRLSIASQAVEGICYLHKFQPSILHRNINSSNLLLGIHDSGFLVKVSGFGMTKIRDDTQLREPLRPEADVSMASNLSWTAPETLCFDSFTAKSDVYSLSILFWELASCEIPYDGHKNDSIRKCVLTGGRLEIPDDTPVNFRIIIGKCWAQEPDDRPTSSDLLKMLCECIQKPDIIIDPIVVKKRGEDETIIAKCLEVYCLNARDQADYLEYLAKIDKDLNSDSVRGIKISETISIFSLMAVRLNLVEKIYAWQTFLSNYRKKLTKTIIQPIQTTETSIENLSCLEILKEDIHILDKFIERLHRIYSEWRTLPISHLLDFFPDIKYVDHDFEILRQLFPSDDIDNLKSILYFWEKRDFIQSVCHGYIILFKDLNQLPDVAYQFITDLDNVDQNTVGIDCLRQDAYFESLFIKACSLEYLHFLSKYFLSNKLIHFVNTLSSDEVDNFIQNVNDFDETLINRKTLLDLVKLKSFFDRFNEEIGFININVISNSLFQQNISEIFSSITADEQFENLHHYFRSCSSSLPSIKQIYLNLTDKESSARKVISSLMGDMTFDLVHDIDNQSFDIFVRPKKIGMNDLNELRDKVRSTKYSSKSVRFQTFFTFVEKVLNNLNQLNICGHPLINDYLRLKKILTCANSNYQELIELNVKLDDLLVDWEKDLCEMYENYIDLTYFRYEHFWIIEDYLYNHRNTLDTTHKGYHLLKYINIQPENIQIKDLPVLTINIRERLENLGKILLAQRHLTNNLYKQEDANIKKIFFMTTTDKHSFRPILSLFSQNKQPPSVNNLFFCTEQTTWMEIRAFIYRCFFSQNLHQLIRPELLSASIQDKFSRLLIDLIRSNSQHYFRLSIVTTVDNIELQLINSLRPLQIVKKLQHDDLLGYDHFRQNTVRLLGKNSIYVRSTLSGLGKTHFIKKQIASQGKNCVRLSISGNVDIAKVVQRLYKYSNEFSQSALHINISSINKQKEFHEMLYCLLLFRSYYDRQTAISIPNDMPIYIEFESSLDSEYFVEDNLIFECMKRYSIESMGWNLFEFTKSNHFQVQFVVNYLQALKDETILKQDINKNNLTHYSKELCIGLLKEHFLEDTNPKFINWTHLNIFITVYYNLFSRFFHADIIKDQRIRTGALRALLQLSNQITLLSVNTIRRNQYTTQTSDDHKSTIPWNKMQPFALIFSDNDMPTFVYKDYRLVPEIVIRAFQKRSTYRRDSLDTDDDEFSDICPNYNNFTQKQFFQRLASLTKKYFRKSFCPVRDAICDFKGEQCLKCKSEWPILKPKSLETKDIEDSQHQLAQHTQQEYVVTADNFIKMLLIYSRIQAGLPVLIMGETGCGKTALIQYLCRKILDDEMDIFHIYTSTTSEDICQQFQTYIEKANVYAAVNKRFWVFLDDFNRTPSIGLLKEIACERTLLGEDLPKNMVIVGACSPPRDKYEKNKFDKDNLEIQEYQYQLKQLRTKSFYSVVPIPETMLDYIWDYGYLEDDVERTYIQTMLNTCKQFQKHREWFNVIVESICVSQRFFRQIEGVYSVSLRDVARFCRFYNWFYRSNVQREGPEKTLSPDMPLKFIQQLSILALLFCYYYRLNSLQYRDTYVEEIEAILSKVVIEIKKQPNFLLDKLKDEQQRLIERMDLPPGIAMNRALKDNIFVLFVCIINRVPVIICGKPGCSRTLAVQIVIQNLQGQKSRDEYFQTLPELVPVSFQGSQNCTSESIIKVFQRADKYLRVTADTTCLPVIVFDEIGLAEFSPYNPLEVLHEKLEIETCRYGFVGLSNWRLDASKMNRALYLSCLDPDVEDLKLLAAHISTSMTLCEGEFNRIDATITNALAVSYFNLQEQSKLNFEKKKYLNYFGLRDFYSLIKGVVGDLFENETHSDIYEHILRQLVINFDRILNSSHSLWVCFCEYVHQPDLIHQFIPPTFKQLLNQRLTSQQGRYLMLIANNESVIDYVERYIYVQQQTSNIRTLIGSGFSRDFISEQYNSRIVKNVILYAETNVTLIMRRMEYLHDKLYDLFNRNFVVSGKKNYCRVALHALSHPRCFVNDNFDCVVFVKEEDLDNYDVFFLNRFEKHTINMDSLADEHHLNIVSKLNQWINEILPTSMRDLFIWSTSDYNLCLVTEAFDYFKRSNTTVDDENLLNYCQNQILRISSFDLPLVLSLQTRINSKEIIEQYYQMHFNLSFASFLHEEFEEKKSNKLLIYSYTKIDEDIDYQNISNHQELIEEINLSYFNTELELTQKIKMHYGQTESTRLLCIRIDYQRDRQHIPILKYVLANEYVDNISRGVCLIFHLKRSQKKQASNDGFFYGWSRVMIDDLQTHEVLPEQILLNPSYGQLIHHLKFFDLDKKYVELINGCLIKLRYTVTNRDVQEKINNRRNDIIKQFINKQNDLSLYSLLKNHLIEMTRNLTDSKDWRQDFLTTDIIKNSYLSFKDALVKNIVNYLDTYLSILFFQMEKYSLIDSFLLLEQSTEQIKTKLFPIWLYAWDMTTKKIDIHDMNINNTSISLVLDLHLPYATMEYDIIKRIRQDTVQVERNSSESTYEQLISTSIYGKFINDILEDVDLFSEYYHDQLILTRNERNVHHPSISFIQCLLTSQPLNTSQDRLHYLLVNYEELFEIMKLFEISLSLLADESMLLKLLIEQLMDDNNAERIMSGSDINLYRLVLNKSDFHLIPPGKSDVPDETFESRADPFIEICLMNIIELLVSLSVIKSVDSVKQLVDTYELFVRNAKKLMTYEHYKIQNLKKLDFALLLITHISNLFSIDQVLSVFTLFYTFNIGNYLLVPCEQMKKDITHYLETHCHNANDKQDIIDSLSKCDMINPTLNSEILAKYLLIAEYFNLFEKLHSCKLYLDNLATTENTSSKTQNDEMQPCDKNEYASSQSSRSTSPNDNITDQISCIDILHKDAQTCGVFINRLIKICLDWEHVRMADILSFFVNVDHIDRDLEILKPLSRTNDLINLKYIFEFQKKRDFLTRLCDIYIKLSLKRKTSNPNTSTVFEKMLNINEQTLSGTVVSIYQDFSTHHLNQYSDSVSRFISQWNSLREMLELLYSLNQNDVDSLIDVVHNLDESFINTKTVFDFIKIKRFLDKVETKLNQSNDTEKQSSLELNDLINCFQELLDEEEFKEIIPCIESCFKNFSGIKIIHLKMINKDESKRQRILDTMTDSKVCFEETIDSNEYQFDVLITVNGWEPLRFLDLNDLRDRARLIQNASDNNTNNLQNYNKSDLETIGSLISFTDTIEMTLKTMTLLSTAGYPVVKQYLESKRYFVCTKSKYDHFDTFISNLNEQLLKWEKQLLSRYKTCLNLTYMSHQEISTIENALHTQKFREPSDSTYHLLKFIDIDPTSIQTNLFLNKSENPEDLSSPTYHSNT